MNQLAVELNNAIQEEAPGISKMLSKLGNSLYMPKGILTQGAEAKEKAYKYNATIGIATSGDEPMYLDCIYENLNSFKPVDIFTYAPTTGKRELRKVWKEKIVRENPSLIGKEISTPIVVNALTHGISIVADLFCNEGDYVVLPDKFWGNYRLAFNIRRGGIISTFPTFNENNGFNVDGLLEKVKECGRLRPKVIVVLNFPNNPTGYTPLEDEANAIVSGLKEIADSGIQIIAVSDDAYFGMFFENSITESIFARLAGSSDNLLAIKLDGATKESFVWGFRVGFVTFGALASKPMPKAMAAMEQKVAGCIRGVISNSSNLSQEAVLKGLSHPEYTKQHDNKVAVLRSRAMRSKEVLADKKYLSEFTYYPFNSGYFLTLNLISVDAEELRLHLLNKYGVGTISTSPTDLRIAFSCLEIEQIKDLFDIVYQGCLDLKNRQ